MAMDDETKKLIEAIREKNIEVGQLAEKLSESVEGKKMNNRKTDVILSSVDEIAAAIGRLEAEVSR